MRYEPEDLAVGDYDLEERQALRRVVGLSTELEDITEVEYRQLRLERVVLVGVWAGGTAADAENSLQELKLLAETAGSQVLEGLIQRRDRPDPATYIGSGKAIELRDIVAASGADTVICDGELTPVSCASSKRSSRSRSSTGPRSSSTSSRSTPRAARARPRSSWRSCSTCCRACAAGAATCLVRSAAGPPAASASAAAAPARPRSSWTGGASASARPSCGGRSRRCPPRGRPCGTAGRPARCPVWRSPDTPTPASRRCSTG